MSPAQNQNCTLDPTSARRKLHYCCEQVNKYITATRCKISVMLMYFRFVAKNDSENELARVHASLGFGETFVSLLNVCWCSNCKCIKVQTKLLVSGTREDHTQHTSLLAAYMPIYAVVEQSALFAFGRMRFFYLSCLLAEHCELQLYIRNLRG